MHRYWSLDRLMINFMCQKAVLKEPAPCFQSKLACSYFLYCSLWIFVLKQGWMQNRKPLWVNMSIFFFPFIARFMSFSSLPFPLNYYLPFHRVILKIFYIEECNSTYQLLCAMRLTSPGKIFVVLPLLELVHGSLLMFNMQIMFSTRY